MKKQLTPSQLRIILVLSLLLAIGLGIGGFILLRGVLAAKATEISQIATEVKGLSDNIRKLESAGKTLKANEDVEVKAREMLAESQSYQYQDRIVQDLKAIAGTSGVNIKNVDFMVSQTSASAVVPQAPAQGTPGVATPTSNLPGGINQTKATITIESPVSYNSLLLFIRALESNSMKMQVSKVSITGAGASSEAKNKDQVTSEAFVIGVYIR